MSGKSCKMIKKCHEGRGGGGKLSFTPAKRGQKQVLAMLNEGGGAQKVFR